MTIISAIASVLFSIILINLGVMNKKARITSSDILEIIRIIIILIIGAIIVKALLGAF